jgi:ABC-type branched-subunit amino acid transport system substrate-binding protein
MVKKNQTKTLGNVKVLAVIGLMTSAGVMAADINQQSQIALISETIKPVDQ